MTPFELRARLRLIWARLQAREDSEHEQALVRIAVAFVMYLYLLAIPHPPESHHRIVLWVTVIFALDLLAGIAILAHIVLRPEINPRRRLFAILIDSAAPTGTMLVGGPAASALYPMLLWIILGHGFRYGRPYLWAAAGLSLVLFGLVVLLNPAWRAIPALAGALVASLVILPIYFAILLRKLTNAIARAEEASRAKSHFLATMSHELRTPLNAIIGMSELLGTTRLDSEQLDMAETVRTAASSLLSLVDQVLDLAKIEERRFTVEIEPFDLHDSLVRLRTLLAPLAAGKGLALRLRLERGTPYRLQGGPRQLHQALVNLVGNAIKFTDHGQVVIRVEPVPRADEAIWLRFSVVDTGAGLSPQDQANLFERFARSGDSVRRGISGSGLGLNITRELVQLMGGRVGMTSLLGQGSTFWLELPFLPQTALEMPERLAGRVIIVGGRDLAADLSERIQDFGCATRCVATAESAAELLRHGEGRQAVVVTRRSPPIDLATFTNLLTTMLPVEPADLIGVGVEPRDDELPRTLVDLPTDVADEYLFASLRAALRRQPATALPAAGAGATVGQPHRRLQVLVAEDNRTNQKVIGKILEHAGHHPTIVATGQEAMEALEDLEFDLVLMDLNMPELDGIEAVKLLRFMHNLDELPPIVALSADATPHTREACRLVGFSAYLPKPVNTQELLRTMAELTDGNLDHGPEQPQARAMADVVPERAAIDLQRLTSLAELDSGDGFIDGLIDDFLADVDGIIAQLHEAAARGDARTFRDQAHALRSSAAHVGALGLFDLCLAWRELDDHALLMRVKVDLAQLRTESHRVRQNLTEFKQDWQLRTAGA